MISLLLLLFKLKFKLKISFNAKYMKSFKKIITVRKLLFFKKYLVISNIISLLILCHDELNRVCLLSPHEYIKV